MTYYAGQEYYKSFSPGSPAPISFGLNAGNDWMNIQPLHSMSLNPGAGTVLIGGYQGAPSSGGGGSAAP